MFQDRRIWLICVGVLLTATAPASAELTKQEKEHIAKVLGEEVNRAVARQQKEGIAFREKVVGRLFQCGDLFLMISKQAGEPGKKQEIREMAEISYDLSALASDGIKLDRFKEIGEAAQKATKEKFAAQRTPETERDMNALLNNCKSLHRLSEVPGAVAALLPADKSGAATKNAAAIEFANELQECSLYHALLAGGLLVEVPQNSGKPLSPTDSDKAVRAAVHMTRSEQIEVLYKRLASMAGVSEADVKARRDDIWETQKRIMGREWNTKKLDERYKAFCEHLLSDAGGKARLQELSEGKVCGGLYKCW